MSDLKLFRITGKDAAELPSGSVALERSLQQLVERNMETMFGVRFLASEFVTGKRHNGRIDSLGIDENGSPVIFEYKRDVKENVINQGLFYLDWLVDHRGDFEILVMNRLGRDAAQSIDWRSPRLVCVAKDFTRYDSHAINQIGRNIELVRYSDFNGALLALELVESTHTDPGRATEAPESTPGQKASHKSSQSSKTVTDNLAAAPTELADLYRQLEEMLEALGDDVTKRTQKYYFAFRRLRNFACVEVHPRSRELLVYLKVDPDSVELREGFSRDVREIGHFGTGNLELRLSSAADLEQARPLIERSYESS